ncbi:MAG: hypothetical protein ACT6RN_07050 [Agrobacterium sp.]|uniref:hypothetical protein n=1 Tax=Agrobacterium sp. TaxID=361 RepID=UPI00403811D5
MPVATAILLAIPPATNHEQAVLLRRNNRSGISGVRRIETTDGDIWQATLMTSEGQKRENFSTAKFGLRTCRAWPPLSGKRIPII